MPQPTPKPGTMPVAPALLQEIELVAETAKAKGGRTATSRLATFPAITHLLNERVRRGTEKYGTQLMVGNGRNALRDAWEECMDLCFYLKQALMEGYPERAILPAFNRAMWNLFDLTRALMWQDPKLAEECGYKKPGHCLGDEITFPDYRREEPK